jgi:uncharacterized protein involved in type VI secretion and phage assembly
VTAGSLLETIRGIVRDEVGRVRTAEVAVVQDQQPHASDGDSDNYACTVVLRDSGLVLERVPVATGRIGAVSIPAVGDMVLVQFLGGDLNAPVVTGRLYNDEDRPPVNDDGQGIVHLPLGSGDSDAVHLELHSGDRREIVVKLGSGLELHLRDDDPGLELDVNGNAKVRIAQDGAVTVESQGDVSIKGNQVTIEAQSQLTLKGSTVNIN